jgi:hypothetical protein
MPSLKQKNDEPLASVSKQEREIMSRYCACRQSARRRAQARDRQG